MNYSEIKNCDIANGAGVRVTLFVSGCTHRCPNCFNEVAWDFNSGSPFDEAVQDNIIEMLKPSYITGLTLLGGEPAEPSNQEALLPFVKRVKRVYPTKDIWMYTGDIFEELMNENNPRHTSSTYELMQNIDVLVDGPFIDDLRDITLRFKGSSNQRVIDIAKTLQEKRVVLWSDDPIFAQHSMGRDKPRL